MATSSSKCPFSLSVVSKSWTWLNSRGYLQGVLWALMVCFISSLNDVFIRLAGDRLDSLQVAFLRFLFSVLTLIPVMLYKNPTTFRTTRLGFHSVRSILLYGAVACWCTGVTLVPLTIVSTLAMTVPLFVLPMAFVFLKEKVGWQRILATLTGFVGILITIQELGDTFIGFSLAQLDFSNLSTITSSFKSTFAHINFGALWLLAAAIMFAASDILNKKVVSKEHDMTIMFYIGLGTTLIGFIPAMWVWAAPTITEIFYLLCLGAGANLILYCLLKAFAATEISALQPYRYVELVFAGLFGYLLFSEVPGLMTLVGAALIIPSTLTIAYYETKVMKKAKRSPLTEPNGTGDTEAA